MGAATTGSTAMTFRVIACCLGYRFCFFFVVDVRDDQSLYAPVQETQDGGVVVVWDTGNGRDAENFGSPDHMLHLV